MHLSGQGSDSTDKPMKRTVHRREYRRGSGEQEGRPGGGWGERGGGGGHKTRPPSRKKLSFIELAAKEEEGEKACPDMSLCRKMMPTQLNKCHWFSWFRIRFNKSVFCGSVCSMSYPSWEKFRLAELQQLAFPFLEEVWSSRELQHQSIRCFVSKWHNLKPAERSKSDTNILRPISVYTCRPLFATSAPDFYSLWIPRFISTTVFWQTKKMTMRQYFSLNRAESSKPVLFKAKYRERNFELCRWLGVLRCYAWESVSLIQTVAIPGHGGWDG